MKRNIFIGFDIDETFIHSKEIGLDKTPYCDSDFNIKDSNGEYNFSTYIRPNAQSLLNYVRDNFNIFFYTRSSKYYTEAVLKQFGMENEIFFHSKYIDVETIDTPEDGFKRFKVKRLDKIANKLGCKINDMLFIDDIKNRYEVRPSHIVIQVPEYKGFDNDNALSILLSKFKEYENLKDNDFKDNMKLLKKEDFIISEKPLSKIKFKP